MGRFLQWCKTNGKQYVEVFKMVSTPLCVFALLIIAVSISSLNGTRPETKPIGVFNADLAAQQVASVEMNDDSHLAEVTLKSGREYTIGYAADYGDDILNRLGAAKVPTEVVGKTLSERYQSLIGIVGGFVMLYILMYVYGRATGRSLLGNRSSANIAQAEIPRQSFSDVGGAEEVIASVRGLVHSFKHPDQYRNFGVRGINGLLLKGPPGTGKTLLARAIAGESGVPFYSMIGADFMGKYLNEGPAAVRSVFAELRRRGGGILFIDELDSIASKRSSDDDSGSKELNNTLNALLTEMDGFETTNTTPILVIGATNRADNLDPGILRRFKMQEEMPTPHPEGRRRILEIHLSKIGNVADDVQIDKLVKVTSGMTGDDLANMVDQAGHIAIGKVDGDADKAIVTYADLMEALDTKQLGSARRSRTLTESEKLRASTHEAGHALTAFFTPGAPRPARLTIVPRGSSGGHTRMEDGDLTTLTFEELKARLVYCMGGRAAERLVENVITTGASSDIEQATRIARQMVCTMGMGKYTAQIPVDGNDLRSAEVFAEIDTLVKEAEEAATRVLSDHREQLNRLTAHLLKVETLDGDELAALLTEPT